MSHTLPLYISIPSIIVIIAITLLSIFMYFRTSSFKASAIKRNEQLSKHKKIKLKMYQAWGPIIWFLVGIITTLSFMAIVGLMVS